MAAAPHSLLSLPGFTVPMPTYPFGLGGFYTVPFYIDFAKLLAAGSITTINPSAGDYLVLAKIPIGAQIHGVLMKVATVCADTLGTGTITVTVGDYSAVTTGAGTAIAAAGYLRERRSP